MKPVTYVEVIDDEDVEYPAWLIDPKALMYVDDERTLWITLCRKVRGSSGHYRVSRRGPFALRDRVKKGEEEATVRSIYDVLRSTTGLELMVRYLMPAEGINDFNFPPDDGRRETG